MQNSKPLLNIKRGLGSVITRMKEIYQSDRNTIYTRIKSPVIKRISLDILSDAVLSVHRSVRRKRGFQHA